MSSHPVIWGHDPAGRNPLFATSLAVQSLAVGIPWQSQGNWRPLEIPAKFCWMGWKYWHITMENHHIYPENSPSIAIFHSYVSLPLYTVIHLMLTSAHNTITTPSPPPLRALHGATITQESSRSSCIVWLRRLTSIFRAHMAGLSVHSSWLFHQASFG